MAGLELVLLLLAVSAALQVIAGRLRVPYPTLLVVGGLLLALIPGLPRVEIEPDALFLIFVPPLLYWGARNFSFRDFQESLGPIVRLAVVMVLVSTVTVALVAHWIDPAFAWPAAFALGAIISPPDPIAVLSIMRSLGAPGPVANALEGEGLLNDATALVLYRMAVAAAVTGAFSAAHAALQFVFAGAVGVAVGLVLAWGIMHLRVLIGRQPIVQNTISLLTPFASYLAAELVGASGILSVVATGMFLARQADRFTSPETRLQNQAIWTMVTFLLESLIFILIGLELPHVTRALLSHPLGTLVREAAIVCACAVLVRLAWVWPSAYVIGAISRRFFKTREPPPPWQWVLFTGWAGMRGGDSLVIALALPFTTNSGAPFPARDQIVFITFAVIFVTLVAQGMTLRPLLHWLGMRPDERAEDEEAHARLAAAEAALAALEDPAVAKSSHPEVVRYLRQRHLQRARRWAAREGKQLHGRPHAHEGEGDHVVAAPSHAAREVDESRVAEYRRLRGRMIQAEREALLSLRDRDVIGDDVLRRLQRDLDLETMLLESPDPVVDPIPEIDPTFGQRAEPTP